MIVKVMVKNLQVNMRVMCLSQRGDNMMKIRETLLSRTITSADIEEAKQEKSIFWIGRLSISNRPLLLTNSVLLRLAYQISSLCVQSRHYITLT